MRYHASGIKAMTKKIRFLAMNSKRSLFRISANATMQNSQNRIKHGFFTHSPTFRRIVSEREIGTASSSIAPDRNSTEDRPSCIAFLDVKIEAHTHFPAHIPAYPKPQANPKRIKDFKEPRKSFSSFMQKHRHAGIPKLTNG